MKLYALSLAVGVGVGVIYGLLQVRSPAPPVIALLGLLGMLAGEQVVASVRERLTASQSGIRDTQVASCTSPPANTKSDP